MRYDMMASMTELRPVVGPVDRKGQRRPLRVCHLAYTFYETDNRVMRYARALSERGDEVDVIALRRAGQPWASDDRGVHVVRLQGRDKTEEAPSSHLLKILCFMLLSLVVIGARQLRRHYDIVHVHNVPDFLVFSAFVSKMMGAKIILDIHDILPELYAGKYNATPTSWVFRGLLLAERLSCRFADHVLVANHLWHERLIRRAVPVQKCAAMLNYPDLRLFRPCTWERPRADGKFVILYPGSLSRHQGLDVAIMAFSAIRDRLPNAEFHIYGEGPASSELRQLVKQTGLEGLVKIMEPLAVEDIARVIASADVGVEPKLGTGFSNEALSTKILEFMASGVPVVVSRTLVHARYFDETVVRFVEPGDPTQLAEALLGVYERRGAGPSLERALEFAAGYSWERRVADYHALLDSMVRVASHREAVTSQN